MNNIILHEFGKIKLDKNGQWFHNDQKFEHQKMSEVFSKSIIKKNNAYFLKLDKYECPIEVEDCILWIIDFELKDNSYIFKLSNNQEIIIERPVEIFIDEYEEIFLNLNDEKIKFTSKCINFLMNYIEENTSGFYLK